MKHDDDWTPDERNQLTAARLDGVPPPSLEDATVRALRDRGLVRPARRRLMAAGAVLAMAAVLVIAVGWSLTQRPRQATPVPSARFVLLLYSGTDPIAGSTDTRRREYSQWARDLAAGGAAVSGEELDEDFRDVTPAAVPPASLQLPRGFFVVSAPDLDAAQRIASTCPHLRYGGRIIVKRIAS